MLNRIEHLLDVLSIEAPRCNLKDLQDLLLMSSCQHTLRGLEESRPQWVACLVAKVEPVQNYAGGNYVMADIDILEH